MSDNTLSWAVLRALLGAPVHSYNGPKNKPEAFKWDFGNDRRFDIGSPDYFYTLTTWAIWRAGDNHWTRGTFSEIYELAKAYMEESR